MSCLVIFVDCSELGFRNVCEAVGLDVRMCEGFGVVYLV